MSAGPFICGMRRFDKHRMTADRPSDSQAQREQQQKLSELMKQRDSLDTMLSGASVVSITPTIITKVPAPPVAVETTYTPWKTPHSK